jgi:hypothetical protein
MNITGVLLFREAPYVWTTHLEHLRTVCDNCAEPLAKYIEHHSNHIVIILYLQSTAVADLMMRDCVTHSLPSHQRPHCRDCEGVFYCSSTCQHDHDRIHFYQCPAYQDQGMQRMGIILHPNTTANAHIIHICTRRHNDAPIVTTLL